MSISCSLEGILIGLSSLFWSFVAGMLVLQQGKETRAHILKVSGSRFKFWLYCSHLIECQIRLILIASGSGDSGLTINVNLLL